MKNRGFQFAGLLLLLTAMFVAAREPGVALGTVPSATQTLIASGDPIVPPIPPPRPTLTGVS
jgi:hypothetical protein